MYTLERNISEEGSYKFKERYPGFKIPIVSDSMFHTMISNENRKQYVSYFFASLLNKDYDEIYNSIKFVKTELDKDIDNEGSKRVDFICKIDNEYVLLEMNNKPSRVILERNFMYAAKIYGNKVVKGAEYNYSKVISININNFYFKGLNKAIQKFVLKEERSEEVYTDKIQIYNIYLPLIKKKYYNKEELSKPEEILLIFNENDKDLLNKLSEDDIIMREYIKDATDASRDGQWAALEYDKEVHDKMIQNSMLREANEKGIETGKKLGIETGKKLGIETGKKLGIDERNLEIARNLLKKNIDINTISECTGLSLEKLKELNL